MNFIQLSFKLNVIAHEQTHLEFSNILQHFKSLLHNLIKLLFNFRTFSVDIFQLSFRNSHHRVQTFFLFVHWSINLLQKFRSLTIFLSNSNQIVHQKLSRTMISFYFTVDTDGSIALLAKEFKFDGRMHQTISDNFRFIGKFSSFMFALQSIIVMRLVARNAKICILSLAVFSCDVILAKFTCYFLHKTSNTSLSSLYFDSLMVKCTMYNGRIF